MKADGKNKLGLLFLLSGFFLFSFPLVLSAPEYSSVDIHLPVFLIVAVASLGFLFAGIFARSSLLAILGGIGLLIAGFLMMQGHILYQSGSLETVSGNITTINDIYTPWDDGNNELFGFFIVVAVAGLLWTLPAEYSED